MPTIAGIDCNFSLPFVDCDGYLPGSKLKARSSSDLWSEIEDFCKDDPDFYGGNFAEEYSGHFLKKTPEGGEYRYRETEEISKNHDVDPQSPFNLVNYQKQVGKSGLAGMRMLHCLQDMEGVAIWPFDEEYDSASLIVVEIFPTLHRRAAGVKGNGKISSRVELDRALYNLEAVLTQDITHSLTGDDTDALISAAGMAKAPESPCEWMPRGLDRKMLQTEGWIFGVGADWTGP